IPVPSVRVSGQPVNVNPRSLRVPVTGTSRLPSKGPRPSPAPSHVAVTSRVPAVTRSRGTVNVADPPESVTRSTLQDPDATVRERPAALTPVGGSNLTEHAKAVSRTASAGQKAKVNTSGTSSAVTV